MKKSDEINRGFLISMRMIAMAIGFNGLALTCRIISWCNPIAHSVNIALSVVMALEALALVWAVWWSPAVKRFLEEP